MKNNRATKLIGFILVLSYFILTVYFIWSILSAGSNIDKERQKYVENIEVKLNNIILNQDDQAIKESLNELVETYAMEVVVDSTNTTLFNTIPHLFGERHFNSLNERAIVVDSSGKVETVHGIRNVWYVIYQVSDNEVYSLHFTRQLILVGVGFIVLSGLTIYLSHTLLSPLKRIRAAIESASDFDFESVSKGPDAINEAFYKFTGKLEVGIEAVSQKYTQLETQLQIEKERLNNTLTVARSFIHDFKTPLHQLMLENNFYIKENENISDDAKHVIEVNNDVVNRMILSVNEILKIMSDNVHTRIKDVERVSLEEIIFRSLHTHQRQITNKNIDIEVILDEMGKVLINRPTVQLLIHNLTSNMVKYTEDNTKATIELIEKDSEIQLKFTNYSTEKNISRMIQTEQIFSALSSEEDNEHLYSSGNGLFLIRDLTMMLNGKYSLSNKDNQVIVLIELKKVTDNET